ncbi:MAG: PRC-barrel domain-containing protein [Candidatus Thalassarchaeaceae archaeon]|jgi:sporulation protein YlmC with PRC-barrel domain|nr:PRC-barrel domain-containing protein [Candidatus Thalassarchaeaceae archaeon]
MKTTFGQEILTRKVVDAAGDVLGHLADFSIDIETGNIVAILVVIESGIDPNELPWPTSDGLLSVPIEEVSDVGTVVALSR